MNFIAFCLFILTTSAFAFEWKVRKIPDYSTQPLPQSYTDNSMNIPREYQGYLEYSSNFEFSESNKDLAIYLGKIGDADKVYINDMLVGQTGDFPPNFQYGMDIERNYIIPSSLIRREGMNSIKVIIYSKYFVNKGLKVENVKIGDISTLNQIKYTNEIKDNLVRVVVPLLCLVLAAISFPLLAPKALWCEQAIIFLLGISSFVLGICRGRICFHYFDMLLTYKTTIISSITTLYLIAYYSIGLSSKRRKMTICFFSIVAIFFIFTMVKQTDLIVAADVARYWFYFAPIYIFIGILFFFQRNTRNYLLEIGLLILFFADVNDVLNDLKIIKSIAMLQTGLGTFILILTLNQVIRLRKSWESFFKKELELDRDAILGRQAVQLAHDIRSPLEALKSAKDEIARLPELEKESVNLAIRRIEEIAYNLLQMRKGKIKSTSLSHVKSTINQIVLEKRLQFRNYPNLSINLSDDVYSYNLFSGVEPDAFKRIISNLLDNAAEAMKFNGIVNLVIENHDNVFHISISDSGPVISKEELTKFFEKGFTTKPDGNGLGLYHAKKVIEQASGSMSFTQNEKTIVKIVLPKFSTPKTFANSIDLSKYTKIIVLDDDESVHQIWKKRFKDYPVQMEHFYKAHSLLTKYNHLPNTSLLLSDFELLGEDLTGIDCINSLNAYSNSILVTARADEECIIKDCKTSGIKILPKSMANEIPISAIPFQKSIVLIDDDKLTHYSWKIAAKNAGLNLISFFSVEEFKSSCKSIPLESSIYVDSDLGLNLKGEILSKEIFDLGFKNINLATGYGSSEITKPFWIHQILGKRPPF